MRWHCGGGLGWQGGGGKRLGWRQCAAFDGLRPSGGETAAIGWEADGSLFTLLRRPGLDPGDEARRQLSVDALTISYVAIVGEAD